MTASSPQSAPDAPPYRITLFYGPEPVEGCPGTLCCTFNVKKRSWKGGVQIAVEIEEAQVARARRTVGFEQWLTRILSTLLDAERADYESRAQDLFVQQLCAVKLDCAIEAGLKQESRRLTADSIQQALDAAVPVRSHELLQRILAELDVAPYGGTQL
ncbi:MAG: hypothetical protein ACKOBZ_00760 [Nitrospira sp.]|nr:hypothetical protein [Nitrospira sp.]